MRLGWKTILFRTILAAGILSATLLYAGLSVPYDGHLDRRETIITMLGLLSGVGLLLSMPLHWLRERIRDLHAALTDARRLRQALRNAGRQRKKGDGNPQTIPDKRKRTKP